MGSFNSVPFTYDELLLYEELTGLNIAEIKHAYKRFRRLDPLSFTRDERKGRVSYMTVAENLKELKVNPLRYRICRLFCSSETGFMDFDDFLDMVSVFSCKGSPWRKVAWAFKIFDINDDEAIDAGDINALLDMLTNNDLTQDLKNEIITRVVEAADQDDDACIDYEEFQRQIYFYPDFYRTFRFNL